MVVAVGAMAMMNDNRNTGHYYVAPCVNIVVDIIIIVPPIVLKSPLNSC